LIDVLLSGAGRGEFCVNALCLVTARFSGSMLDNRLWTCPSRASRNKPSGACWLSAES
jgi:hypothetical protein